MAAWDLGPGISVLRTGPWASLGKKEDILELVREKERQEMRDTGIVLEASPALAEAEEKTARRPLLVRREAIALYTLARAVTGERRLR